MEHPTPQIKFEHSPAESFVSTPGTQYPSLFSHNGTMDPSEAMTPPFDDDDDDMIFDRSISGSMAGTPAPQAEKKPVKKRKSWGQQLPEPKTNLPPRKRAKTEDEKEQRRVERVLRNRRAAQSSRERKRQEVEALEAEKQTIERRYRDLEMRLADSEAKRVALEQQIVQITGNMTVFNQSSPTAQSEYNHTSPITLSQELFSSQDQQSYNQPTADAHRNLQSSIHTKTVNPASLSPEIRPVPEFNSNASSSDLTQHPAAMLCDDLQCQSKEQRPWMNFKNSTSTSVISLLLTIISVTSISLTPLSQILNSLTTGSSLPLTNSVLSLIIWLVTTPTALLTSSTSTTSCTTTQTPSRSVAPRPRFSLRVKMLQRILTCSPQLARPLKDAALGAMRSLSEKQLCAHACLGGTTTTDRPNSVAEPSMECLMTLVWVVDLFEKGFQGRIDGRQSEAGLEMFESVVTGRAETDNRVLGVRVGSEKSKLEDGRWSFGV